MNLATDATADQFRAAFTKAQPAAVQALMAMPYGSEKIAQATTLAGEGYVIEGTIHVWGYDSYYATKMAVADGYTWVPSWLQPPIELAPGLSQGTVPAYLAGVVPPGAIIVTLDMDALAAIYAQRVKS